MKTIQEQIQVMQHYANGGQVEILLSNNIWSDLRNDGFSNWNFAKYDFRIKEKKKTITLEKWLCEYTNCELLEGSKRFFILEKIVPFEFGNGKKVKLLESKEIEL